MIGQSAVLSAIKSNPNEVLDYVLNNYGAFLIPMIFSKSKFRDVEEIWSSQVKNLLISCIIEIGG